jgi:O-antigen ligase
LVVFVLIVLASQVLSYLPKIPGPLTPTMILELVVFALLLPRLYYGYLRSNHRSRVLLWVLLSLFVLSFVHISETARMLLRVKLIFTCVYVFILVACVFQSPDHAHWLRRLHLIPAYGMILGYVTFIVGLDANALDLSERIGGNDVPTFLAILVPLCWVQLRQERGGFRWLNLLVLIFAGGSVILSASRGGTVCLVVAVLYVVFVLEKAAMRVILISGLLIVLIALGGLALGRKIAFLSRVRTVEEPEIALNSRIPIWKAGAVYTWRHPWFGGDFRAQSRDYIIEVDPGSRMAELVNNGNINYSIAAHNGYLEITANYGLILGFLFWLYFILLARSLYRTAAAIRERPRDSTYLRAGLGCLAVFGIANLSGTNCFMNGSYVLWAMLECYLRVVNVRRRWWPAAFGPSPRRQRWLEQPGFGAQ